jgi:hypothetical protein
MKAKRRIFTWFLTTILIGALICLAMCGNNDRVQQQDAPVLSLMDRLAPADSNQPDEHFKQDQLVTRRGLRRKALVLVAPVRLHASLQGISGKATLKGWAAPVFNIGDGFQMNLFLSSGGVRYRVGSRYFDSGRRAEDRDWIPVEVSLEIGENDWLEIEISAGPQGDLVADWLALSELVLDGKKGP